MVLYTGFIFTGSIALAWWYGLSAYRGYFMSAAMITVASLLWACVGETMRPERQRPWTVLCILLSGALTIFFLGHSFGFQREQALYESRIIEFSIEQGIPESQSNLTEDTFGIGTYLETLQTRGIWEKGPRRHGGRTKHVTGDNLMIALFFHLVMLVGGAIAVWRAGAGEFLDTTTDTVLHRAEAIPFPTIQPAQAEQKADQKAESKAESTSSDDHALKKKDRLKREEPPWQLSPVELLLVNESRQPADETLWAEISSAVQSRDADDLLNLAKRGVSPNILDVHGVPLLSGLIRERARTEAIVAFAENGIDPKLTDSQGNTFLHALSVCDGAGYGYFTWQDRPSVLGKESLRRMQQLAARIVASGGAIDASNAKGVTPLMNFARFAEPSVFEFFLRGEVGVNLQDTDGRTALMLAAGCGDANAENIHLLLEKGADAELRDGSGATAADYAAKAGSLDLMQKILARGQAAPPDEELGRILLKAVTSGSPDVASELVAQNADLTVFDSDGKSALFLAAEKPDRIMVELLLEAGASPNGPPGSQPPLQGALWGRDEHVLTSLLTAGADPSIIDASGRTPITTAISFSWRRGLELLIEAGADPRPTPSGFSPFMALARSAKMQTEERFAELVSYLSELELSATTVNENGLTALCYLCGAYDSTKVEERANHVLLARHLVEQGADPEFQGSEGTPRSLAQKKNLTGVLEVFSASAESKR